MLSESEQRAAELAVSRYGLDTAVVQRLVHTVQEQRARGVVVDLIDALEATGSLNPGQVRELRQGLEKTQIDVQALKNGVPQAATLLPDPATAGEPEGLPPDLKTLGDYRLLRRLGEGGMGAVFLGYQESQQRQVALKVLAPVFARSQSLLDRFYREARSGAALDHPHIVRNLAVSQDRATQLHYLVLEYVDGYSALDLLERFGHLSVADAVHLIMDIARALEHAHSRRIVHRDIKPGNILVTRSGIAKLSDLGLAKRTDEASQLTLARQGFGTPYYMPYEQAMNAKYADERSDIYALGATLYHLVVGEVPFAGRNSLEIVEKKDVGEFPPASHLNPDVPVALDRILNKMMAREPEDRYQSASELLVDLERSDLAATVPSFIDPDQALQDPVVRQRLENPAQSTCPDLHAAQPAAPGPTAPDETWFLRYRDRHGQLCKAKATTTQIRERLASGKLLSDVEAAPSPQGTYLPLAVLPKFQDLPSLGAPSPVAPGERSRSRKRKKTAPVSASSNGNLWLGLTVAACILTLVAVTLFLVFFGN